LLVSTVSEFERVVLDHGRRPRHRGRLPEADALGEARHPSSGEHFTVGVKFSPDGRIAEARFDGEGSVLSVASASLMTEAVSGRTPEEAMALAAVFKGVVTGPMDEPIAPGVEADLAAFAGIRQYPVRVPCALLGWKALERALTAHQAAAVCG
jgi:nitrogen fixation NifU-like protein